MESVLTDLTANEAENDAENVLMSVYYITYNKSFMRDAHNILKTGYSPEETNQRLATVIIANFGISDQDERFYYLYTLYIIELFLSSLKFLNNFNKMISATASSFAPGYAETLQTYLGGDFEQIILLFNCIIN